MKNKFTEEQIVKTLTRLKKGERAVDLGRELGISDKTIYNWKARYKDMTINEAKRVRELESENAKLKRLVADQALDILALKEVNSKKW